jgi:hypothetical protein
MNEVGEMSITWALSSDQLTCRTHSERDAVSVHHDAQLVPRHRLSVRLRRDDGLNRITTDGVLISRMRQHGMQKFMSIKVDVGLTLVHN